MFAWLAGNIIKPTLKNVASKLIPLASKKLAKWTGIKSI